MLLLRCLWLNVLLFGCTSLVSFCQGNRHSLCGTDFVDRFSPQVLVCIHPTPSCCSEGRPKSKVFLSVVVSVLCPVFMFCDTRMLWGDVEVFLRHWLCLVLYRVLCCWITAVVSPRRRMTKRRVIEKQERAPIPTNTRFLLQLILDALLSGELLHRIDRWIQRCT